MLLKLKRARAGCEVSGAMVTVLRVLRLFGVAPLRFTRIREGVYRISSSRIIFVLGCIFTLFVDVIIISILCCIFRFEKKEENFMHTLEGITIYLTLALPSVAITSVAILKGKNRMEHLMTILNQIEGVRSRIRYDYSFDPTARNVIFTIFGSLLLNSAIYLSDMIFGYFTHKMPSKATYLSVAIQHGHSIMLILQLEFYFFAKILRLTTEVVNQRLLECNVHEDSRSTCTKIYSLSTSYLSICKMIKKVIQAEGLLLIMILFTMITRIFITMYNLLSMYTKNDTSIYYKQKLISLIIWVFSHSIKFALLIEPFHRLNNEMESTREIISKLIKFVPRSSVLYSVLDNFTQQFQFKQFSIAPLGLVQFTRPLIATIAGCVVTFLIINHQFQYSE